MNQEIAEIIEQQHNVYIDTENEMFTYGNREDTYGWNSIPVEWIEEAIEEVIKEQ